MEIFALQNLQANLTVHGPIQQNFLLVLYEHFNDKLIISYNCYFVGIIQPVSFWDFPLLLKSVDYLNHELILFWY